MKQKNDQTKISCITLPRGERLIICSSNWCGKDYVDFRIWYNPSKEQSEESWHPTKKGFKISIVVFRLFLKEIIRAAEILDEKFKQ